MRTSTYLLLFVAFILFIAQPARAQVGMPIFANPEGCSYENPCFLATYEKFSINAAETEYTIEMTIVPVLGDSCSSNTELIISSPAELDGPQILTLGALDENPNVILTVNKAQFDSLSQVVILVNVPTVLVPGSTPVPILSYVITFNTKINTEESCLPIVPLPVELISFEGKASASGIALEWSTASEKDNSHFEVERSADGQAFEQIGKVNGNGNSSVKRRYNFTDSNPTSNLNYYRLKQVDFDGKSEYSKVISVTADVLASTELSINLAPNPCQDGDCSAIIANPGRSGAINLELKDMSGRVIFTKTITETNGNTVKVPMAELASHKGLFILTATSGTGVVHKRIVLR